MNLVNVRFISEVLNTTILCRGRTGRPTEPLTRILKCNSKSVDWIVNKPLRQR